MGKKKMKPETYDAADIISIVTKSLNKKGRIKGDSKKETKMLKLACPHHKFVVKKDAKGRKTRVLKATIETQNGKLYCKLCGQQIKGNLLSDKELDESLRKTMDVIQQMKYLIPATSKDSKEAQRYVTRLAVDIGQLPSIYSRLRKVVSKAEQVKKKKRRSNYDSSIGDWSTTGRI